MASIFDPDAENYEEKFLDLSPLDREIVEKLTHNLAANISNSFLRDIIFSMLDQYRQAYQRASNHVWSIPFHSIRLTC